MTSDHGLAIVLRSQSEHLASLRSQVREDLASAQRTSVRLDALERELLGELAPVHAPIDRPRADPEAAPSHVVTPSYASLVDQATAHLTSLGIDRDSASFDDLLDTEEIARIERRFDTDFAIHARLDRYDILAVAAAGLAASLLDILLVGIPKEAKWWGGGGHIKESPLTARLRDLQVDPNGKIAEWAKVSYDRVSSLPETVDGLGPLTHRVQTFAHDPLLGLVFGVRDIMRGTMTAIPRGGGIQVLDIGGGESNPFMALALQIGHLISDVGTPMGIPAPGWTALVTLGGPTLGPPVKGGPIGQPGAQENLGEIARRMYLNGYDSRHFITMATSAAVVDVVLRGYWGLRRALDPDWREVIDSEADRHGSTKVSDHPRFASMSLGSHGVAAAGDLVKLALAGGNPLALNYPQWLAFLRAFFRWADDRQGSVAGRVDRGMRANERAVEAGWARLDFGDPAFVHLAESAAPSPS